jgi:hypothetical protein
MYHGTHQPIPLESGISGLRASRFCHLPWSLSFTTPSKWQTDLSVFIAMLAKGDYIFVLALAAGQTMTPIPDCQGSIYSFLVILIFFRQR